MAAETSEIKCLILPVQGRPVVLPNAAVAEIITQQDIEPCADAPPWLLGTGQWRGMHIPLVAFDSLTGERADTPQAAGRFVVVFGLEGEGAPGFYGIRIDALPRSETVDAERLQPVDGAAHPSEYIGARARLSDERQCLVPDFDALGQLLTQYAPRPTH
jgi:chemosensory pili system protein ChpC